MKNIHKSKNNQHSSITHLDTIPFNIPQQAWEQCLRIKRDSGFAKPASQIYECTSNGKSYILKIGSGIEWWYRIYLEMYLQDTLKNRLVSFPRIVASGTFLQSPNMYYQIIEKVDGLLLHQQIKHQSFLNHIGRLGHYIATIHTIQASGFGPLALPLLQKGQLNGIHDHWEHFLSLQLDDDLTFLTLEGIIDNTDASNAHKYIIQYLHFASDNIQSVLLHGDIAHHNAMLSKNNDLVLLDWEDSLVGDPWYDLAYYATGCFGNEAWFDAFLTEYGMEKHLLLESKRFWLYYLRIALYKAVSRIRQQKQPEGLPNMTERIRYAISQISPIL